jgi:hypothetical protein
MRIMTNILIGGAGLAALATAVPAASQYYSVRRDAVSQCAAAVDDRLVDGHVVAVTDTDRDYGVIHVTGIASSGYGPYGVGAYGALAYGDRADLMFRCDVDDRGFIRDVDIDRRY